MLRVTILCVTVDIFDVTNTWCSAAAGDDYYVDHDQFAAAGSSVIGGLSFIIFFSIILDFCRSSVKHNRINRLISQCNIDT